MKLKNEPIWIFHQSYTSRKLWNHFKHIFLSVHYVTLYCRHLNSIIIASVTISNKSLQCRSELNQVWLTDKWFVYIILNPISTWNIPYFVCNATKEKIQKEKTRCWHKDFVRREIVSVTKPSTELSPKSVTKVSEKKPKSEKSRKKSRKRSSSDQPAASSK